MCFLAVLMLKKAIDEHVFAKILQDLGFSVEVRKGVVEAWRDRARMKVLLGSDRVEIRTNDYGSQCVKDYEALIRSLIELETAPEVIYFSSPYIYSFEKKRGRTKKFFEELGLEVEEVYSGRCG